MMRVIVPIAFALVIGGCHRAAPTVAELGARVSLQADSAQFTVASRGALYQADIGFQFSNHSGRTLSMNYCHAPAPPVLEKQQPDGGWSQAYGAVMLMCLTLPPFRIPDGGSYHGILRFAAGGRGTNVFPAVDPDSIPGVYRLRWELRAGEDPNNQTARLVRAVSPPFRLLKGNRS